MTTAGGPAPPAPRYTGALPERAQAVVVGGGIVGCSIAYHLARRGISDVLLLEQNTLTGGTTWHAAGLVSKLKSGHTLTRLAAYTAALYEELEDETGQATGYRNTGSITVASDDERWEEIRRGMSMAKTAGIHMEEITPERAREMWPLMRIDDLVGVAHLPEDGQTSPVDTTMALAKGARDRGVVIREGTAVERVRVVNERAAGVETERGFVETDTVVLACGMWTRQLAAAAGVNVPLHPCEHFYVVTGPLAGMTPGMPTLRDPTNFTYFKEESGKLMAGFFEPRAKTWKFQVPRDFTFGTLPEDWEHIGPVLERSIHRIPALEQTGIQLFLNGPEAFTPDGVYYLGESPEVDGLFVAAGFNSVGIQSAGGAGWALADWIADRRPPMDLTAVDLRRAFPVQAERPYLEERISESLGLLYAMHWPFRQFASARDVFRSPLHDRLALCGAVFGEAAGWERPNWFAPQGMEREYRYSYGKQNWYPAAAGECEAARNRAALFDQSSFAKFRVSGPEAMSVLNRMGGANIDVPAGKVVYTQWLNERGGIEADLTVTRRGEDEFLVITGAAAANRDFHTLRRALRGRRAELSDVTEQTPTVGVMGPRSRDLLSALTGDPLDDDAFPFGWSREITVAGVPTLALRISYVGELGWELNAAPEGIGPLWEALMTEGSKWGAAPAGYHAMNSLRLEAGYRHWGHDITDCDDPFQAGLSFTIDWDKPGGFTGREALRERRADPVRPRRLVQFRLRDADRILYHDEPIFRDGTLVGRTTSGMFSHTFGACLAMGYVENREGVTADWLARGRFEIEAGDPVPAEASLRAFYKSRA